MHKTDEFTILVIPGLNGSDAEHWQTAWERVFPDFERVEQRDWDKPVYEEWSARLTEAVKNSSKPVVLVAHSLGTSLVMRWAHDHASLAGRIAGAFMVAPTDRDIWDRAPVSPTRGFAPMLLERLPFRTVVVASRNDERVSFERAQLFAQAWGATLIDAGHQGHMGNAAKLGLWPFGLLWFGQFLASLDVQRSSE